MSRKSLFLDEKENQQESKKLNLKKGDRLVTRDGRTVFFAFATKHKIWFIFQGEENPNSFQKNGFWRSDGFESPADVILNQRQLSFEFEN